MSDFENPDDNMPEDDLFGDMPDWISDFDPFAEDEPQEEEKQEPIPPAEPSSEPPAPEPTPVESSILSEPTEDEQPETEQETEEPLSKDQADPVPLDEWLGQFGFETSAKKIGETPKEQSEADEPAPASFDEPPDWLSDYSSDVENEDQEQDEPSVTEIPDWLSDMTEDSPSSEPDDTALDVPDWLAQSTQEEEEAAEDQVEIPVGLSDSDEEPEPDKQVDDAPIIEQQPSAKDSGLDWLNEVGEAKEPSPTTELTTPSAATLEPQEDVPDWLSEVGEQSEAPQLDEPSSVEPAAETPEWLSEQDTQDTETERPTLPPAWLADIQEKPPEPELSSSPAPAETDASLDWLMQAAGITDQLPDISEEASVELGVHSEPEPQPEQEPPAATDDPVTWLMKTVSTDELKKKRETESQSVEQPESADASLDWLMQAAGITDELPDISEEAPAQSGSRSEPELQPEHESPPPEVTRVLEQEAPEAEAVPEWLKQDTGIIKQETVQADADDGDGEEIPDWLKTDTGSLRAQVEDAEEESEAPEWLKQGTATAQTEPEEEEEEIPDWLKQGTAGLKQQPLQEEVAEEEIPDWLSQGMELKEREPVGFEEDEADAVPDVPDWMVQAGIAGASSDEDEMPDWLAQADQSVKEPLIQQEESAQTKPERIPTSDAPDWLVQAGLASKPQEEDNVPEWLASRDEDTQAVGQETESDEQTQPPETAPEAPSVRDIGTTQVPDNLGEMLGIGQEEASEDRPTEVQSAAPYNDMTRAARRRDMEDTGIRQMKIDPKLAQEIQDLRFGSIVEDEVEGEQEETVGALKNVSGVIRPEVIFEGSALSVEDPIDELVISETQARRVQQLQQLVLIEEETVSTVQPQRKPFPLIRLVIVAVLALAVALPTLLGATFMSASPQVQPGVQNAFDAVNVIPADAVVLIAFDYDPESAAELEPLAVALLEHLATRPDASVYAISTRPAGPQLAEQALTLSPKVSGKTWTNLGYVSGDTNGIRSLEEGSLTGSRSPFEFDAFGLPTELAARNLTSLDLDLLIVLASRPETLRGWVEQTNLPPNVVTIAGVGANVSPLAMPYAQSGQVDAVLVGTNDAMGYHAALASEADEKLVRVWNGQTLGSIIVALILVVGGVFYTMKAGIQPADGQR